MFDAEEVKAHQQFIVEQSSRKTAIGKEGYAARKFWEELGEFSKEIQESFEKGEVTDNFINELGDVLFCTMGYHALAQKLMARMAFNKERAERYKQLDLEKISSL